mmetsp:Transcript_36089/g.66696  ORF Transcript_36089/g.66696 Transcript_36089/m.66696 type:complete len:216 (-) Transcript_36089:308-955(-)
MAFRLSGSGNPHRPIPVPSLNIWKWEMSLRRKAMGGGSGDADTGPWHQDPDRYVDAIEVFKRRSQAFLFGERVTRGVCLGVVLVLIMLFGRLCVVTSTTSSPMRSDSATPLRGWTPWCCSGRSCSASALWSRACPCFAARACCLAMTTPRRATAAPRPSTMTTTSYPRASSAVSPSSFWQSRQSSAPASMRHRLRLRERQFSSFSWTPLPARVLD